MAHGLSGYGAAVVLVILSTLFWGGNFVLGRAVSGDIPPISLAWWRWVLALAVILPFALPALWHLRSVIRKHWRYLVVVSLLGVTIFNTFVYLGLETLPASNAVIMLSSMPVLILALERVLHGGRMMPRQVAGTLVSIVGVAIIVAEGEGFRILQTLGEGKGSLWVLLAVFSWALYSVLLKRRPSEMGGLPFFAVTALFGWILLTPLYGYEQLYLQREWQWNREVLLSVVYVGLFASIFAFLFWNRGVQILGPGRAGHFIHLIPVWGLVLAAVLLGERLLLFHWIGMFTIGVGILLASLGKAEQKP